MQFRYLNADEIGKFADCFRDDLLLKSGLSFDELATLSKGEFNELINIVYKDEPVNKDNIHLYYEFMSDEDLKKYKEILADIFEARKDLIPAYFENISLKGTGKWFGFDGAGDGKKSIIELDNTWGSFTIKQFVFGVKDTLKPIDEYITEIKDSAAYKEYIASLA